MDMVGNWGGGICALRNSEHEKGEKVMYKRNKPSEWGGGRKQGGRRGNPENGRRLFRWLIIVIIIFLIFR